MRFSTCHSLIAKRGFFAHQNFFQYDSTVGDYFFKRRGLGAFSLKCFCLWFDSHHTQYDTSTRFSTLGLERCMMFGYFLLCWLVPHGSFALQRAWLIVRLFQNLSYRGRRHLQGLSVRGQRTHSNSRPNLWRRQVQSLLRVSQLGLMGRKAASVGSYRVGIGLGVKSTRSRPSKPTKNTTRGLLWS